MSIPDLIEPNEPHALQQGSAMIARRAPRSFAFASFFALILTLAGGVAADWPAYRGDAGRTGYTAESLPADLSLAWVHRPAHTPQPAWPRGDRMTFDWAYQPIAAANCVYYGGSVDGVLCALDLESGQLRWRFQTDAPIRFAPAAWRDRLFVASDDGFLYALAAADGRLLWKKRGGPDDSAVLGNQRLISRWPARGGPVVADDVVYFAAGIWPSEGIYLYALDAQTGNVRWCNDDSGSIYMPQPHPGANAHSGVSAQGYLAVSGDQLFVPTGRAVPAVFDRHTGLLQYFHLQRYGRDGNASIAAAGPLVYNSGHAFHADSGDKAATIGPGPMAIAPDAVARGSAQAVELGQLVMAERLDRKGQPVTAWGWESRGKVAGVAADKALIIAGDKIVCGSTGRVQMIDAPSQQPGWSAEVDGSVRGLAATGQRLLVSTDHGQIYCFAPKPAGGAAGGAAVTATRADASQAANAAVASAAAATPEPAADLAAVAAEEIVRRTGLSQGYCVDLGCGDGQLALQLAQRTKLLIYAVEDDAQLVERARRRLTDAGLYGSRVVVHQRDLSSCGYPSYFADLVVSSRSLDEQPSAERSREAARLRRPSGGALCLGPVGEMQVQVRPALEGEGSWTHQYADAANTLCSQDATATGPLGMLWFRDVDFDIPSRHGRAPAPLYAAGRLFHEGLHGIVAVDAYNGRELWRYEIPNVLRAYDGDELMGTAGTGGNLCLHDGSVYVRDRGRCLRLDAANGRLLGEFTVPASPGAEPGVWGYVAAADGILFGSVADDQHIVTFRYLSTTGDMTQLLTESRSLFARDARTGRLLWQYAARHSIRHNAIAISQGRVLLIDRPLALFDRHKRPESKEHPPGALVALDAKTGQPLWQNDEDVYGTLLAASDQHDALLMSYQPTRFRLDSEFGGRLAAFRASDGQRLWDVKAAYDSRPLINGDTVYAQGGAWKLLTGERVPFELKRSYGCGIVAASQNLLVFRSATLGYRSFEQSEPEDYGGIRPGCWINAIPAGGLVLVPDATSGCTCSYLNKAWIALTPR